jgi:hypothetical protein
VPNGSGVARAQSDYLPEQVDENTTMNLIRKLKGQKNGSVEKILSDLHREVVNTGL